MSAYSTTIQTSVADPERFDAVPDPDPTVKADADPDPNPFTSVKKKFPQIFNYCFQSLPKLVIVEARYFCACFSDPGDIVRNPPN